MRMEPQMRASDQSDQNCELNHSRGSLYWGKLTLGLEMRWRVTSRNVNLLVGLIEKLEAYAP